MAETDDILAGVPVDRVAAWYRRLALGQIRAAPELQPALAGAFLLKWLDNRMSTAKYTFQAPEHLKTSNAVFEVQKYHRDVFGWCRRHGPSADVGGSPAGHGCTPNVGVGAECGKPTLKILPFSGIGRDAWGLRKP